MASGERERAIQRQLLAAEMRLEEAHEVQVSRCPVLMHAASPSGAQGLRKRFLQASPAKRRCLCVHPTCGTPYDGGWSLAP